MRGSPGSVRSVRRVWKRIRMDISLYDWRDDCVVIAGTKLSASMTLLVDR